MNKMLKTLLATTFIAGSACAAVNAQAAEPLKIGVSFQEMNNPYFVTMKDALQDAAKSIGATLVISDAHHDVSKQVSDIEDMVQQGVQVVLINPTDSVGVASIVKTVHDKNIPIVSVDAQPTGR